MGRETGARTEQPWQPRDMRHSVDMVSLATLPPFGSAILSGGEVSARLHGAGTRCLPSHEVDDVSPPVTVHPTGRDSSAWSKTVLALTRASVWQPREQSYVVFDCGA